MMKHYFWAALLCLIVVLTVSSAQRPTTIFIIGDSTAADKPHPDTSPERGWAMMLQGYFDSQVIIENHAVNGRSSKSFRNEGRWDKVLQRIKPGDYVIIQFGHNDEKSDSARHTDAQTTFYDNLLRYANEAKAKGAHPILMSPVARRNFFTHDTFTADDESLRKTVFSEETINSDTLVDTHGAYRHIAAKVACQSGAYFIDANKITTQLEEQLGAIGSRKLHMWIEPGQLVAIPKGRHDNTHYNIYGASTVARLMADALAQTIPALKRHILHPDMIVSTQWRGQYTDLQAAIDAAPENKKTTIYVLDGQWKNINFGKKKNKISIRFFNGNTGKSNKQ